MTINGILVDIKTYETKKGKVMNLYIREESPYSVLLHVPLWQETAETVGSILQVNDNITASAYASAVKKGQISLSDFNLLEVKRTVVHEEKVIFSEQPEDPVKDSESDD